MKNAAYEAFEDHSRRRPNAIAVVDGERCISYSALESGIVRLAIALEKSGASKGSRIAMLLPNSLEFVELTYAAFFLGAVPIPLNWRLDPQGLSEQIAAASPELLIYSSELMDVADSISERMLEKPIDVRPIESFVAESAGVTDSRNPVSSLDVGDPALVLFTSGSTGMPKAAMSTQGALASKIEVFRRGKGAYGESDAFLLFNPLFHQGGLSFLLFLLSSGSKVVLQKSLRAAYVVDAIRRENISHLLLLPPSLCTRIRDCPCAGGMNFEGVKCVTLTGGRSAAESIRDVFGLFPNASVRIGYGHTENAASLSIQFDRAEFERDEEIALCVGIPEPGCDVRIVDEQGNDVAPGQTGELMAKSPAMFERYLNAPRNLVEGYFATGDLMSRDEKGRYRFKGRKRDMIKTGGENVLALEVEKVLEEHPDVREASVFSMDDEFLGESIAAAVVLERGRVVNPEALVEFCRGRMASYKKPRSFVFLDELPRTSTGKHNKRALVLRYGHGDDAAVWRMNQIESNSKMP